MTGFRGLAVKAAAPVSLVVISAFFMVMRSKDEASPVLKTMVVFLALETVGVWVLPPDARVVLGQYTVVLLYGLFLAMALIPLLAGWTPFTTFFAKKTASKDFWETDIFRQINRNMTGSWAGLFFACGLLSLSPSIFPKLGVMPWTLVFRLVLPAALLLGPGRMLNKRYPPYYLKKIGLGPQNPETTARG
ncbi:MAG: hypothetical protein JEZ02_00345 [Desulfatibacillum sp.]|nr:hypothetical protein [Desulfatibacillum sp.]